jgi:hypothetical protein
MECRLAGETEVRGENLPQRHFCPSQNPTWPDPGLNPDLRRGKPATNRLSYGAVLIFILLSLFWKNKKAYEIVILCVYEFTILINFSMPQQSFLKLGTYITAPEPIKTAYAINPFHQCVSLCVYSLFVARRLLGKNIAAERNTHTTIEELLDASSSMRSMSNQKEVGN